MRPRMMPMQLGDDEPKGFPERPERMMSLDALSNFVPVLKRSARRAWKEADQCRQAVRPTDEDFAIEDARALEILAHHLDVRKR